MLSRKILSFALIVAMFSESGFSQSWSEFRGPAGSGISTATEIPQNWTEANFAWTTSLPGRGWSSPVIREDQIWMTTAIENKENGTEKISSVELQALCVDRVTGKILHQIPLFKIDSPPAIHLRNSYASPTPAIDGDLVICSFGTMGTAAINGNSGKIIWKHDELKLDHETGPGSSPMVWKDCVFLNCDGMDQQYIAALDKTTGRVRWKIKRSGELHEIGMYQKAFSTPIIWDSPSGPQLISAGANWVYSYSPDDGKELWKVSYGKLGFSNVPRPFIHKGMLYVCTGFMRSSLLAVKLPDASNPEPEIVWSVDRGGPTIPSPILVGDLIYMVSDDGIASCIDVKDGSQVWYERLKGSFAASPILIEGNLWFCNDDGKVFVVAPSREYNVIATNQLDEQIMATPAAIQHELIVRTKNSLYSIQQNPSAK